ncbi:MAG: hypothetical protein ABW279_10650, partial [Acidimicrobiales bacterium]
SALSPQQLQGLTRLTPRQLQRLGTVDPDNLSRVLDRMLARNFDPGDVLDDPLLPPTPTDGDRPLGLGDG